MKTGQGLVKLFHWRVHAASVVKLFIPGVYTKSAGTTSFGSAGATAIKAGSQLI